VNNFWDEGEHQQHATGSDSRAVIVYLFLAVGVFLIAVSRCFA
jgi:hypothetical protein